MGYVLAIDQGTTSTRAILFGEDRAVVATGQEEFRQHFPRSGWVAHDPSLADPFAPNLKLWFHQDQRIRSCSDSQAMQRGKNQAKRNERHIRDRQAGPGIRLTVKILRLEMTQVGALAQNHPLIRAEGPCRLPITDINAVHLGGTVLKQAIGEAAG